MDVNVYLVELSWFWEGLGDMTYWETASLGLIYRFQKLMPCPIGNALSLPPFLLLCPFSCPSLFLSLYVSFCLSLSLLCLCLSLLLTQDSRSDLSAKLLLQRHAWLSIASSFSHLDSHPFTFRKCKQILNQILTCKNCIRRGVSSQQ